MSKIKITLGYVPADGKQISFRSPCSSADTTGLVIDDVEYLLVDADGVNVSQKENLWNSGAIVSVILDTVNALAYVQNANSNTYLEEQLADKLSRSGDTLTGELIAQNNTNYTAKQVRNIFLVAEGEDL